MQPFRALFDQVWLSSKIARYPLKVCMHGYLSNGYLNFVSNFNYEKYERVASIKALLDQLWITRKITLNIIKGCMHSYLPNAQINLWSNFYSEKLVKSETLLCGFAKLEPKGGENILKRRKNMCACLSLN